MKKTHLPAHVSPNTAANTRQQHISCHRWRCWQERDDGGRHHAQRSQN